MVGKLKTDINELEKKAEQFSWNPLRIRPLLEKSSDKRVIALSPQMRRDGGDQGALVGVLGQYMRDGGNQGALVSVLGQYMRDGGDQVAVLGVLGQYMRDGGNQDAVLGVLGQYMRDGGNQGAVLGVLGQYMRDGGNQGALVGVLGQYMRDGGDQGAGVSVLGQYMRDGGDQGALVSVLGQYMRDGGDQVAVLGVLGQYMRDGGNQLGLSPLKIARKAKHQVGGVVNLAYEANTQSGILNFSWKKPKWTRGLSFNKGGFSFNLDSYSSFSDRVREARNNVDGYSVEQKMGFLESGYKPAKNSVADLELRLMSKDSDRTYSQ